MIELQILASEERPFDKAGEGANTGSQTGTMKTEHSCEHRGEKHGLEVLLFWRVRNASWSTRTEGFDIQISGEETWYE